MQAVILAAGIGRRLGKLTEDKPKCMVSVNSTTIVENALKNIKEAGIEDVVMVTGHARDKLERFVRDTFPEIKFTFVYNDDYATTNNIYSLYLARDFLLRDDTILLESDVLFEKGILKRLLEDEREVLAVVDRYQPWMDGTVVKLDNEDNIVSFIPKEFFNYDEVDEYYKTVNIYKFSKEFMKDVYIPFLQAYVDVMGRNEYYELVLRVISFLEKARIKALKLKGEKWYEIDTVQDIKNAECVFAPDPEVKHAKVSSRYGGYWRFPFLKDFCYLVNPYFPPKGLEEEIKFSFRELLSQYPSGMNTQRLLSSLLLDINDEWVVVGNGASELISALGDLIDSPSGIMAPTFNEYKERFPNIKTFPTPGENFSYTYEDLIAISEHVDTVVLINPDNPSGNYIPKAEVLKLLENLISKGKRLVLDESFVDFSYEGGEGSLIEDDILREFPNLIVLKSISKSYGVPGLRLGVLATSNKEVLEFVKKRISIWNVNSFAEFFMQIFPKYRDEYREACFKLRKERERFFNLLKEIPLIDVLPSQSNYFMAKVKGMKARELTKKLLWEHDILIKDLSQKEGVKGEFVRIAIRNEEDNNTFIEALKKCYSNTSST